MTPTATLSIEIVLMLTTVIGIAVSATLTADSWIRYLRVKYLLDGNYFPRMHLRIDITLLIVQVLMGVISLTWLTHLFEGDIVITQAISTLWVVFPARLAIVALLTITQAWNAWDRHAMHFGDKGTLPHGRRSSDFPANGPVP